MTFSTYFRIGCAAALTLLCAGQLMAGEITSYTWSSSVASIAAAGVPTPVPFPNNDDIVGSSGILGNYLFVTQKAYFGVGPADIEFTVVPSGGVTEYWVEEGVSNGTGFDFTGYRLELGFGMGAGFVPSASGDGLDFDAPDFNLPTSFAPFFTAWSESEDVISASGGLLPNGGFSLPYFRFAIDVPDGITNFTLRQLPIVVPEPASMALLGLGAVCWLGKRRRSA